MDIYRQVYWDEDDCHKVGRSIQQSKTQTSTEEEMQEESNEQTDASFVLIPKNHEISKYAFQSLPMRKASCGLCKVTNQ